MFWSLRAHGAVPEALGVSPDGSVWGAEYYPRGFHTMVATLSEALAPRVDNGVSALPLYLQGQAGVVVLGVLMATATVLGLRGAAGEAPRVAARACPHVDGTPLGARTKGVRQRVHRILAGRRGRRGSAPDRGEQHPADAPRCGCGRRIAPPREPLLATTRGARRASRCAGVRPPLRRPLVETRHRGGSSPRRGRTGCDEGRAGLDRDRATGSAGERGRWLRRARSAPRPDAGARGFVGLAHPRVQVVARERGGVAAPRSGATAADHPGGRSHHARCPVCRPGAQHGHHGVLLRQAVARLRADPRRGRSGAGRRPCGCAAPTEEAQAAGDPRLRRDVAGGTRSLRCHHTFPGSAVQRGCVRYGIDRASRTAAPAWPTASSPQPEPTTRRQAFRPCTSRWDRPARQNCSTRTRGSMPWTVQ